MRKTIPKLIFALLLFAYIVGAWAAASNSPPSYGSVSEKTKDNYIVMSGYTHNPKGIADTTNVALSIYSPAFKTKGGMAGKGITVLATVGDSLNYSDDNSAVETLACALQVSFDGKTFADVKVFPDLIKPSVGSSFTACFSTSDVYAPYYRIRYYASIEADRRPNRKRIYGMITTSIASPGK